LNTPSPRLGGSPANPAAGHQVMHPARTILLAVFASGLLLCLLSVPQKILIGADPWALEGYIVPALFGVLSGLCLGTLLVRNKQEYLRRIAVQQDTTRDLVESEERFRLLAENARDVIFLWSLPERRYQYLSPSVYNLTGHLPEEFYTNPGLFLGLVHEEDAEKIKAITRGIDAGDLPPTLEYRLRRRDGKVIWINQRHTVGLDRTGAPATLEGICTDVSDFRRERLERISLEHQLQQSQKMEAIGRLAGGIAHDFNNLLTVIQGYVDMLMESPENGQGRCLELEEIDRATRKAADLTQQLLAFSRNQVCNPQTIQLGPAVRDSLAMITRTLGESIRIKADIQPTLPEAYLDPTHLDQILVNLMVNARDAIEGEGNIEVVLRTEDLSDQFCLKCEKPLSGNFLVLTVRDDGSGIPPDNIGRIFDPFFTTKSVGQGTGLGLSTVFGIVHQVGGHLQVDSTVGQGSEFRVLLPIVEGPARESPSDTARSGSIQGQGETILVVEDEALIRSLASTVLQQYGYQIHLAENGHQALEVFDQLDQQVDLLLTDIVMPGMDGLEMANQIRRRAPGTPVLFMSGYLDEVLANTEFDPEETPLLKKPFGAEELVRRVRQMIDEGS
jgi:two-component system cell cycle sensor histidine kinase/response regulator CckA